MKNEESEQANKKLSRKDEILKYLNGKDTCTIDEIIEGIYLGDRPSDLIKILKEIEEEGYIKNIEIDGASLFPASVCLIFEINWRLFECQNFANHQSKSWQ